MPTQTQKQISTLGLNLSLFMQTAGAGRGRLHIMFIFYFSSGDDTLLSPKCTALRSPEMGPPPGLRYGVRNGDPQTLPVGNVQSSPDIYSATGALRVGGGVCTPLRCVRWRRRREGAGAFFFAPLECIRCSFKYHFSLETPSHTESGK